MPAEASERIVNFAMYLAAARGPVKAEQVQREVEGYPPGQDEAAFLRMFERDKDELRAMGFVIVSDAEGGYALDQGATFASQVTVTPQEAAILNAVGGALLDDPSFPFAEDLRLALSKLSTALDTPDSPVRVRLADEVARVQGLNAAELNRAVGAHKRVSFGYTNSRGEDRRHDIEPYGLFLRDGRWYAVGRDTSLDEVRVYAVARMDDPVMNAASPKTADFTRPEGFDVATFIGLPFQYGSVEGRATVRFAPSEAWRAKSLTGGSGLLESGPGGTLDWHVTVRDDHRLLRWIIENGPGLTPIAPPQLVDAFAAGLGRVAGSHG